MSSSPFGGMITWIAWQACAAHGHSLMTCPALSNHLRPPSGTDAAGRMISAMDALSVEAEADDRQQDGWTGFAC